LDKTRGAWEKGAAFGAPIVAVILAVLVAGLTPPGGGKLADNLRELHRGADR
jgi:hypothetical protein